MSNEEYIQIVDAVTGEIIAEHLKYKGRRMTVDGAEIPDPTPMAPPVGYKKQPSMFDIVREQVRLSKLAEEAGAESFEEANDFDVGDDYDPESPHETEELDGLIDTYISQGRIVNTPHGPAVAPPVGIVRGRREPFAEGRSQKGAEGSLAKP